MKIRPITIVLGVIGIVFAVFWILLLSGNILWVSDKPPLQVIRDMDNQMMITPQEEYPFFRDRSSFRLPPANTVPRNVSVYTPETIEEAIAKYPQNPLPATNFVLSRGKNRFEIFCMPCHGADGKGNGTVVQRGYPNPPDLTRDVAIAYPDARIFHIISKGQNVMPSYADKLSEVDRWAVVHYIRVLQGQLPPQNAASASKSEAPEQKPSAQQLIVQREGK